MPGTVDAVLSRTRQLIDAIADPILQYRQRDTVRSLVRAAPDWRLGMTRALQAMIVQGSTGGAPARGLPTQLTEEDELTLVDNDTIETEILTSAWRWR